MKGSQFQRRVVSFKGGFSPGRQAFAQSSGVAKLLSFPRQPLKFIAWHACVSGLKLYRTIEEEQILGLHILSQTSLSFESRMQKNC